MIVTNILICVDAVQKCRFYQYQSNKQKNIGKDIFFSSYYTYEILFTDCLITVVRLLQIKYGGGKTWLKYYFDFVVHLVFGHNKIP